MLDISSIKIDLIANVPYTLPDPTLYESIKNITFSQHEVIHPTPTNVLCPDRFASGGPLFFRAWSRQHGALIQSAFEKKFVRNIRPFPVRSIFPGPYLPVSGGAIDCIGGLAFDVFVNTIRQVKQRIPDIKKLHCERNVYQYATDYVPKYYDVSDPEEGWTFTAVDCPKVQGVSFPLPDTYEYTHADGKNADATLRLLRLESLRFLDGYVSTNRTERVASIARMFSLIRSVESINIVEISELKTHIIDEILQMFLLYGHVLTHANILYVLFEVDHAVSYMMKLDKKELLISGVFGMFWMDVFKMNVRHLVETEFCEIERVLREMRTFFTAGWAPIIVHIDKDTKHGFNVDGTHRHYALLTIELLRRMKQASSKEIRHIDINSPDSTAVINQFSREYEKDGLSLRETLRVVMYLCGSKAEWPFLRSIEQKIHELGATSLEWVPVIYLPEWRARTVVKNLCDDGIGMVGVPPENIEIVGRSNGMKGIFIRGGYHGTDRQPSVWMNYAGIQRIA